MKATWSSGRPASQRASYQVSEFIPFLFRLLRRFNLRLGTGRVLLGRKLSASPESVVHLRNITPLTRKCARTPGGHLTCQLPSGGQTSEQTEEAVRVQLVQSCRISYKYLGYRLGPAPASEFRDNRVLRQSLLCSAFGIVTRGARRRATPEYIKNPSRSSWRGL